MLSQQSLFLALDYLQFTGFFCLLLSSFNKLYFTVGTIDCQFLLPETLNLTFMFKLTHAALLCIHLFETFVLCKLHQQLLLEIFFQTLLFSYTLSLKSHLEIFCLLQLLLCALTFFKCSLLTGTCSQLTFLIIKLISEVLLELLLSTTCKFLSFKFFKDLVTSLLSSVFCSLDLVEALLLLLSILADHLIFECLHLLLTALERTFLVHAKDHVSLSLLHFKILNSGHLSVLINHSLDHVVNLFFFF